MDMTSAKVTSDGWFAGDMQSEPRKCRRCGRVWVTGHKVCGPCNREMKYERSNYYFLRAVEIQTLDMGVQIWA